MSTLLDAVPLATDSGSLLGQAFDRIPVPIVIVSGDGRIAMVNAQAEAIFGYSRGEMQGQALELLVPERFRHGHVGFRDGFFASPDARAMGAGRDLHARRKDGSEFPVEIGLNPIQTDQGPMVLSAIVDISERRHMEERFRRVVESAPNAMVMINRDGRIVMVNTQTERVFGYTRAEMLDQPVEMLVPERMRGAHPGFRTGFFKAPDARPMGVGRELFARRKDGSEFPVEIGLNPIETDEGQMVLSAIVDITDRKQKEDGVRAALQEKELLLGEIHHRVKNNLQIINSLLDLQAMRIDDVGMKGMLRDSQNRVRSMSMIHQTLYQSHDFADVDFQHFLQSLVPTLLESHGADASRIALLIDAHQVRLPINSAIPCGLIVNELVTNALKHGLSGGLAGQVHVELTQDPEGDAVLSVSNTGVEVPADLDFSRATTLGMQLVTLLTRQIGGRLTVQRADPVRFEVRFPLGG